MRHGDCDFLQCRIQSPGSLQLTIQRVCRLGHLVLEVMAPTNRYPKHRSPANRPILHCEGVRALADLGAGRLSQKCPDHWNLTTQSTPSTPNSPPQSTPAAKNAKQLKPGSSAIIKCHETLKKNNEKSNADSRPKALLAVANLEWHLSALLLGNRPGLSRRAPVILAKMLEVAIATPAAYGP